jgi:serine/threonine-protein kinase CTR1
MKGFVKVITNKGESARLKDKELVLGEKIGGGYESEVFKSTWLGTEVAVKYFRYTGVAEAFKSGESSSSYDSKNSNIKSFCNEVAIMMGLRHRNIITLMGFGISPPTQFIVMEYMPRGSLFDILGSKEVLTAAMKSQFVTDIVDGLLYLHEGKPPILHQDLKSLNLLVAEDWTIKIADFGIARELKRPKASSEDVVEDTEESADHGGTLQWLAPECLVPEFAPTKEMDIYALG